MCEKYIFAQQNNASKTPILTWWDGARNKNTKKKKKKVKAAGEVWFPIVSLICSTKVGFSNRAY